MICDSCNGEIEYADDAYGVVTQSVKDVPTSPGAVRKLFCPECAARHYGNDQAKLVQANRIALEHLRVTGRLPTPAPKPAAKPTTKPWWKVW